jgi:hypothetical protein
VRVEKAKQHMPTRAQNELWDAVSQFLKNTVSGWVSAGFKVMGPTNIKGFLDKMVTLGAVDYFNRVAHWIDNREDEYVNTHFDKMLSIDVGRPFHPYDLVQILFAVATSITKELNVSKLLTTATYDEFMQSADEQIGMLLAAKGLVMADKLTGCACEHEHEKLGPSEDLFITKVKHVNEEEKMCHFCKKTATSLCAGCKKVRYCSNDCQKKVRLYT